MWWMSAQPSKHTPQPGSLYTQHVRSMLCATPCNLFCKIVLCGFDRWAYVLSGTCRCVHFPMTLQKTWQEVLPSIPLLSISM